MRRLAVAFLLACLLLVPEWALANGPSVTADPADQAVTAGNSTRMPTKKSTEQPSDDRPKDKQVDSSEPQPTADPQYPTTTVCGRDGGQAAPVIRCHIEDEPDPTTPSATPHGKPKITSDLVLSETKKIGLPKGTVSIQPPNGETLVNLPTIFSTQDANFDRTVTLLGTAVQVRATPTSYHWNHGDGTSQTTAAPGRPYPAKDITHKYLKKADQVLVSVDITYAVQWRVVGGAFAQLDQSVTTTGPTTALKVNEAVPVLIAP